MFLNIIIFDFFFSSFGVVDIIKIFVLLVRRKSLSLRFGFIFLKLDLFIFLKE